MKGGFILTISFVDSRLEHEELYELRRRNVHLIFCPKEKNLYDAISCHPDIQLHIVNKNSVIVHKHFPESLIDELRALNIKVFKSSASLQCNYPYDIMLNALNIGDYFIHKLNFTDKNLLDLVKAKRLINTNQGYTKCSTAIVSDNAIITSDTSIRDALNPTDIDILFLPPGDILLPGLDYGFIGGTCGLIDKSTLAFFGDLSHYKYGEEVLNFLKKHNVHPLYLRKGPLIDRGSILSIF